MKKIVIAVIVCMSLFMGACKEKLVSTTYTIGCMGYQYGAVIPSDWQAVEDYFSSNVAYNKLIEFENKTVTENDAEALSYFDEQMKKVDTAYVCSLLSGDDYYIYGIATLGIDNQYRFIKALKFKEEGVEELDQ